MSGFEYVCIVYRMQYVEVLTISAAMPQHAATANILNTAEPTIVPIPISPSVINVPMTFTNNSGLLVAPAINVAPTD